MKKLVTDVSEIADDYLCMFDWMFHGHATEYVTYQQTPVDEDSI